MEDFELSQICVNFTSLLKMKWSELREIAKKHDYEFFRHGKKHDIFIHKINGKQLPIERHWNQEIRKGLLIKLKKQIGF